MPHRPRPVRPILVAVLAAALAVPIPAPALGAEADQRPAPAIGRAGPPRGDAILEAPDSLIVRWRPGSTAAARRATRAAERLAVVRAGPASGLEVVRPAGRSLQAALEALRARPEVEAVALNHRRQLYGDPAREEFWAFQWGHHNVGQTINGYPGVPDVDVDGYEALLAGVDGASVVVAVTDDGVDFSHPDLAGRAWVNPGESGLDGLGNPKESNGIDDDLNGYVDDVHGWDFCHGDNTVHDAGEDFHGTAVAGAIAGALDGQGIVGVAPGVRIMAVKWLVSDEGCNTDDLAIAAIGYAASFGVPIINASWGGGGHNPLLEQAIAASGALFVAAAGNGGADGRGDNLDLTPDYPAAFGSPNILSVAAIHNEGGLAGFSNYGPTTVDLSAPGEDVPLPFPLGQYPCPSGWCWANGTSFAAPYVSGVAALAGAADPALLGAPTALRSWLLATAEPLPATSGKTATGGLLNARNAIDRTAPVLASRPAPLPLVVSQLGTSSVRLRVTWAAAVDASDRLVYRLERRVNGGSWAGVGAPTTSRQVDLTIPLSGANEFRVRATDASGNVGLSPVAAFTPVLYQETTTLAARTGTWRSSSSSSASGGRTLYTTGSGASMTLTFRGKAAALVAPRGPTRSSFKVYVDGVYVRTVSLYSASFQSRRIVFSTGFLTYGTHTLKLVNTRVGSRWRGEVDAFVVLR